MVTIVALLTICEGNPLFTSAPHIGSIAELWALDKKVVLLVVWYMLRPTSVHCNATFIVDIFHNGILVEMQTTCNCHSGCVDERNKWHQHIVCPYIVYYLRDIKLGRWTIPHIYVHEVGIFNDILCSLCRWAWSQPPLGVKDEDGRTGMKCLGAFVSESDSNPWNVFSY